MNDLAEKALEGIDAARREVHRHPAVSLAAAGFAVAAVVVVAGGRASAARPDRPLSPWFGLQDVRSGPVGSAPGLVMLAAILTLAVLWVVALWLVSRHRLTVERVWWLAGAWAVPFVLGPPLMDTSVDTYVAFGRLLRAGRNPTDVAPVALGDSPVVAAIDPAHRGSTSTAGPLGTLLQHVAVSVGNGGLLSTVVVWRVIGVLTALAVGRAAGELAALLPPAPGRTPAAAVAAWTLNPLVLLYVVSAPHLDAVMAALVLAAAVSAVQHRWWRALALAALGSAVAAPGLVALPVLALAHWTARRRRRWWPVVSRDLAVVAVALAVPSVLQPGGWRVLHDVRNLFSADRTPYSVAGGVEHGLALVVRIASDDDLAAASRLTAAVAAACVLGYLLVTVRRRPVPVTVGCALLWLALLAPVLQPWYLLWGVAVLGPVVTRQARAAVVGVSVAACVLVPQGFTGRTQDVVAGTALGAVALAGAAAVWWLRPPADREQQPVAVTA